MSSVHCNADHAVEVVLTEDEAYEVLGLAPGADPERADAAHRRLASRAHPDRWMAAPLDEQEAVRERFEEVNEAYRVLKAGRKAGLGSPASPGQAGPRRRTAPREHPEPASVAVVVTPQTTSTGGAATVTDVPVEIEDDPVHKVPKGLAAAAAAVAVVVVLLAAIGLTSPSADGSRQRSILGPLAHRLLEAERAGDHGTMWDLAESRFKASFDRAGFVARLDACPRRRAPRQVTRMVSSGGDVWEVGWVDPAGSPGLSYFRQEATYRFGAILDDGDLLALLAAPVEAAPQQRWCRRR